MEQNSNGGTKQQEEQEKREQKISRAYYSKTEMKCYYVVQSFS
jgi:hypothetical protein